MFVDLKPGLSADHSTPPRITKLLALHQENPSTSDPAGPLSGDDTGHRTYALRMAQCADRLESVIESALRRLQGNMFMPVTRHSTERLAIAEIQFRHINICRSVHY